MKDKVFFEEMYEEIFELTIKDNSTVFEHVSKLTEEVGEFVQVINKLNGRKRSLSEYNVKELQENLLEEAVDCIQVIFSILAKNGYPSLEYLYGHFPEKNKKYEKFILNKTKEKINEE